MNFPYVVLVEYPHAYKSERYAAFETVEDQRAYARLVASKSGPRGTDGYVKVTLATITEEMN